MAIDTENPNPAEIGKFGSALHLYPFSYRFDDHGGSFWLEERRALTSLETAQAFPDR